MLAAILVNQYTALAEGASLERVSAPGAADAQVDAGLSLPIEELGLSARTANALVNNDIKTLMNRFISLIPNSRNSKVLVLKR